MWIPGGNEAVTSSPRTTSTPSEAPASIAGSELRDRVVIGDAEHVQTDRGGSANQVHRADHPVTRERVRMYLGDTEPVGDAHASSRSLAHRSSVVGS